MMFLQWTILYPMNWIEKFDTSDLTCYSVVALFHFVRPFETLVVVITFHEVQLCSPLDIAREIESG